jgi:serine/threonine protein kinase
MSAAATSSVESICNALVKSKLLTADDVKNLYTRWRAEAKDQVGQAEKFARWLVVRQYLTEYQATLIHRNQIDNFFLHDYKILDRIGAGRMAGIFKSIHKTGSVVAAKVLPPSKARNAEMFGRFQREARMAVKLKHPNVVRTFQLGQCRGLHYIVMEYLEGETLEDVLKKRGQLPPAEAVRLVHQALLGLQHIHDQSLIHRDLKPANLMLVPAPRPDSTLGCTVKLLDIGLGKMMFDEDAVQQPDQQQLTTDGAMLGSPEYMAPEQAKNAHRADIRADIYTLGCVLYHCLAGRSPYHDVNIVRIMLKHATESPKPLRESNPQVPDGLQQIVNCMLEKDPAKRYPTPEKAAQALQVFLASAGDGAKGPEVEPRMQAYLSWLNTQPAEQVDLGGSPPAPGGPFSSNRLAGPASSNRVAAAVAASKPPAGVPKTPAPARKHAAPPLLTPTAADVELLPAAAPPAPGSLARRDLILIGVVLGIASVVLMVGLAFAIVYWLRQG